jgi:hypothetical protein
MAEGKEEQAEKNLLNFRQTIDSKYSIIKSYYDTYQIKTKGKIRG